MEKYQEFRLDSKGGGQLRLRTPLPVSGLFFNSGHTRYNIIQTLEIQRGDEWVSYPPIQIDERSSRMAIFVVTPDKKLSVINGNLDRELIEDAKICEVLVKYRNHS